MKLIALQECWHHESVPPRAIAPGDEFELPRDAAESLIRIGAAKSAEEEPEPETEVATVAEPEPEPETKPTRKRKAADEES